MKAEEYARAANDALIEAMEHLFQSEGFSHAVTDAVRGPEPSSSPGPGEPTMEPQPPAL